ncbi:hypothetical protein BJY01DRAFT_241473 [Aspergillus pseudoustus]|uniref:Retrovirus-related Pol polyprotein from transposon TNT 1-94-like beta-barrel domain-containing protein n=1 Tax=Aspergillus pseudoustus TaxID=1810923 RepID=A0ABR4IDP6_9EURO
MGKKSRASKQKKERGPEGRCWDWMIACGDSHYAKNRASFVAYSRIARRFETTMLSGTVFVEGVGTVELRVRSSPEEGAPTRTLVLENVLHVPNALCNGFAVNVWFQECGGASEPYWYAVPFKDLEKLVLAGDPQGESYLDDGPTLLTGEEGEEDSASAEYITECRFCRL